MRTAIITATATETGDTIILAGEAPYSDMRQRALEMQASPPRGIADAVLWVSDGPSKPIRLRPVDEPPVKSKAKK